MPSTAPESSLTRKIFRYLCLLTAVANAGGNVGILLFYRPIFDLLGVPLPRDLFSFFFVSGFSFTVGVMAFLIFRAPEKNLNLLVIAAVGKAIYSFFTFYFFFEEGLHWFYRVFGVWDGAFAVIFLLFIIHLSSSDLDPFSRGEILPGLNRPPTRRALLLFHSLTGNGSRAMQQVEAGLVRHGYAVDRKLIESTEPLFHFPFSLLEFARITVRAIFRRPTTAKPLGIPADHPYDLIVVGCQTWLIGMGAPTEAIFADPANRAIFAGRDAAAVTVCRGLWRRTQAMTVRHLQDCGANVVGACAHTNPGWEPARTFSLFIFFGAGKEGTPRWLGRFLQPQHLDEGALADLQRFGEGLAQRPTSRPSANPTTSAVA
jgi:hypothetical protein